MVLLLIYIFIGCLHGFNTYWLTTEGNSMPDPYPFWYHILSGVLWPISGLYVESVIYNKICDWLYGE